MSLQGKQVLIIDDSEDVRYIARKIFESLGLTVLESPSVDLALNILKKKIPHLIMLDLEMPGKSGFDFLTIRSQKPELKSIPVIVASSRNDNASVHMALALGADNYVLKPLSAAVMGQRVRKHIRSLGYMQFQFSDPMPDLVLQIRAQITGIRDTGFMLASSVRLAKNCPIELVPPSIDRVDLTGCVLVSGPDGDGRGHSGRYTSRINVMGLKETISKQLKNRRGT